MLLLNVHMVCAEEPQKEGVLEYIHNLLFFLLFVFFILPVEKRRTEGITLYQQYVFADVPQAAVYIMCILTIPSIKDMRLTFCALRRDPAVDDRPKFSLPCWPLSPSARSPPATALVPSLDSMSIRPPAVAPCCSLWREGSQFRDALWACVVSSPLSNVGQGA